MSKNYISAEILHGSCENVPTFLKEVKFHGVKTTKTDALVQEISELYNSQNLDELVKNSDLAASHMQSVGLFDKCGSLIETRLDPNTGNELYTVNFVVKEPQSLRVGLKIGMMMSGDADASISAGKKSIFGRGESADWAYAKTIKGGHSFNFSALKPLLGWQKYSNMGASIFRNFETLRWNKTDLTENAICLQYNGRPFSKRLLNSLRLNMSWRYFDPQQDAPFLVREHAGHTTKFSVEHISAIDTRNRPILASSGVLLRSTQEYAGLLGDSAFIRNQIDIQAAAPLFWKAFLGASLRISTVQSLAERSIHLLDRVYMGGPFDVRGFETNSIGTKADTSSLGGAFGCVGTLHLYRPLIPKDMLFMHAFLSAGSVCSVRSRNWIRDISETPRVSTGAGLTLIYANMIRLELNYVLPLRYIPGDNCSPGIQFGVGLNFL